MPPRVPWLPSWDWVRRQVYADPGSLLQRRLWALPLIAAVVLAGLGYWVRTHTEGAIRREVAANLITIRDANAEALRAWAAAAKAQAEVLAAQEHARTLFTALLRRARDETLPATDLIRTGEYAALRAYLQPLAEGRGFKGYAVLDTNLVVLNAAHEALVGAKSPRAYAEPLSACFAGESTVTPPFLAEPVGENAPAGPATPIMFAAAPIHSLEGRVIGILALRISPEQDFTRILDTARSGTSGETYAFNREGLLLSESRFDGQLKRLGLIPDTDAAHSLLALDLRDPLVDLSRGQRPPRHRSQLPFIRPVAEAVAGREGVDVDGYRDYRGVHVVGAWLWLPEFQAGLVAQEDVTEALAPVRAVRYGFGLMFGLLLIAAAASFVFMRIARQAALKAGQLGQYALDQEIGSGGFGTVFRAHHALMRRPVAVKVLTPLADDRSIARFEREVQMTCQLTHPNTIALYDYGRTPEGLFYYAMEFLDGLSLKDLIDRHGAQPEGRVIHILRQVCGSLAEAHAFGLVHRDIKPQNIFLTRRGGIPDFVKVLDFGLVKSRNTADQLALTVANTTLGTPLYMSPEAVRGPEMVDERSDLYSLATVGYELLTGQTVFSGASLGDVLLQHVENEPERPSTRTQGGVSPDLEELLMRCLAKKPSARPPTAAALEKSLAGCVHASAWTREMAEEWWSRRRQIEQSETKRI